MKIKISKSVALAHSAMHTVFQSIFNPTFIPVWENGLDISKKTIDSGKTFIISFVGYLPHLNDRMYSSKHETIVTLEKETLDNVTSYKVVSVESEYGRPENIDFKTTCSFEPFSCEQKYVGRKNLNI